MISPLKRSALALAAAVGLLSLTAAPALATNRASDAQTGRAPAAVKLTRIGSAPVLPLGTQPLAAASSNESLRVTVALQPRHPAALAAYASAVSDPGSESYHEYLSPAEFATRFGASAQTVNAVRTALERQGLTPGQLSANHLSFDIVASAGSFEHAMNLQLAHVELPDHHSALVNIEAPAVPATVAGDVQAIVGLDGLSVMRSDRSSDTPASSVLRAGASGAAVKKHQPTACAAASSAASSQSAYTDNQIAAAYNFTPLYDAGDEGAGVTVGVYELEPNLTSDIAAYQTCYGTDTAISYQEVDGGAGSGAGSGEAAFDIEQLIGFAPKATLIVYQGPNSNSDNPGSGPYDLFSEMISDDKVQVISNSWGECEAQEGASDAHAENTLFQEAAVQGQTVLSAAGDDGSEDCYGATSGGSTSLAVDDPGSQPYVTDVGGTSLTAIGSPSTEVVWNGGGSSLSALGSGSGAGGGGISGFWPMPAYQSGAPSTLGVINSYSTGANCANSSGDCREVPDVAADADPAHGYLIYYNGNSSVPGEPAGWQSSGGTSGAAPLWAALFADADADSACDRQPIGFANPALYKAAGVSQAAYFHDITSGNNDYTGLNKGLYPAGAGYDLASGLGTPNAAGLATVLCQDSLRLTAPTSTAVFAGGSVRLAVRTADASGSGVSVTVAGLPPGVSFNHSSGVISGRTLAPGVHVVKVTATDTADAVRTATFVIDVAAKPTLTGLSLSKVASGQPVLNLRVTAGRDEAKLGSLSIVLPAGLSLRSPSDVAVKSASGAALAHTISGVGRKLTIKLTVPASPLLLQFKAGALNATSVLKRSAAAKTKPKLNVSVVVKDVTNLLSTLKGSVKPAS